MIGPKVTARAVMPSEFDRIWKDFSLSANCVKTPFMMRQKLTMNGIASFELEYLTVRPSQFEGLRKSLNTV
jgi:hypothetical protein